MKKWFQVDTKGLAEIAKRRGVAFIVTEPIQNAWDEKSSRVEFELTPVPGSPKADIVVRDDSPDGFRDLADSYMMFRTSYKLDNPEQRGRFNIGEKLLLSVAESARIDSTTGSVIFSEKGRTTGRTKTKSGSVLSARLRMTRGELNDALNLARTLIPPPGILTTINGEPLPERTPVVTGERALDTEIAGVEGGFSYTSRKTTLQLYDPLIGEQAQLYEMGIPVDKIDCAWHVNVGQKVPLSLDRSSVRTGYLMKVQRLAAEIGAALLDTENASEAWVSGALDWMEDDDAVRTIVKQRFGKAVTYDPSAPEANKLALDAGYKVVHGGEFGKMAWSTIKRAKALKPAGKVFDDGKIRVSPDGVPVIPRAQWTEQMERVTDYVRAFAERVIQRGVGVEFYDDANLRMVACYGDGIVAFNMATKIVREALEHSRSCYGTHCHQEFDALLIHELAHEKASDHMTHAFGDECCRIGAALRGFCDHL